VRCSRIAPGAIRSLISPDARIAKLDEQVERLKKALDGPRAEVFRQNEVLRDRHDAEAALAQTCQRKLDDIQFAQEAKNSASSKSEEACLRELDTVRGVALHAGEAGRFVGGRVYVGVRSLWAPEDAGARDRWFLPVKRSTKDTALASEVLGQNRDPPLMAGAFLF
jgi:hypothetical protein